MFRATQKYISINGCNVLSISFSRYAHHTNHYKVLNLKPTCSSKEIREAFITLSKELHPDANVSKTNRKVNSKSFVQLLEAYKVLSKPDARARYDYELLQQNRAAGHQTDYRFWQPNPAHYQKPDPGSYYGIKGVKRVSNWTIVLFCGVFMTIGIILQVIAIKRIFTKERHRSCTNSCRS
ncbi:dnaJ-like protein 60 isoform X2 [Topomyia yanbarensis]|uniref:dnaJ-like protein 60 isoform X2 n=1 Tax=Topomyia yanbarensis TaxID=2498891 RepID=UPI00273C439D|nr:dnaJ-like protein 60 isoform X2 [Topomyia yanbarensis]